MADLVTSTPVDTFMVASTQAGMKNALGLVKSDVGLGNVDNTADTAKPVSTAQATADTTVATAAAADATTKATAAQAAAASDATTKANAAIAASQPVNANLTAEAGLTGASDKLSYYTGVGAKALATLTAFGRSLIAAVDLAALKTILSLVKGDVGLGNVDNTSDANKPVSTATLTALNAKISSTEKAAAGGVATLDGSGKLLVAQLPAIAIVDYLGAAANQSAMLALAGQQGDWCTRTDLGSTWVISGADPTQLSSWTQLSYPTAPVTTVAGRTGAVTLAKADVGLGNADNTADSAKPVSTAQAAADSAAQAAAIAASQPLSATILSKVNVHGADIASASTTVLDSATGDLVDVTGTTAITAITLADGLQRIVRFTGALTLTNGASLVLPGGANITTAAGDFAIFRGYAAAVVRCVAYIKANGKTVIGPAAADITDSTTAGRALLTAANLAAQKTNLAYTFADLAAGTMVASATFGENTELKLVAALSADGKYCGITEAGVLGETVAFGEVCYFKAADSRWWKGKADAASTSGDVRVCMCVLAGAAAAATVMLVIGKIRADALFPTMTIGAPVHLSAATSGAIVVTAPTGTDSVTRRLGFATTADEFFFNPSNDYLTHT